MFHKAKELIFNDGTTLELVFQTGEVKRYDMADLFSKYPQMEALKDRKLFLSGTLMGCYGIIWNDELNIETETIYEDGITVRCEPVSASLIAAQAVLHARAKAEMSQAELSKITGIDQSDISKIERGLANPSVGTLFRLANALGGKLSISIT